MMPGVRAARITCGGIESKYNYTHETPSVPQHCGATRWVLTRMIEEDLQITVNNRTLAAIRVLPEGQKSECMLVYAPGAGSNLNDRFGKLLAQHLAGAGISTVRFQFLYMEDRKRRPDPPKLLEETWREVIQAIRPTSGKLVIGGRSMGGRIASHVVAQGTEADGLALFAYPLHPPSNPEKLRDVHLPNIFVPTLFCSGTRDSFATPEELEAAASKLPNSVIHQLEGADHGFAVLKSSGRTQSDVWTEAAESFLTWLSNI